MSTYIAVFAMVLAYVALVAAYFALRTLARVRRATSVLSRGLDGRSVLEATERITADTAVLGEQLVELRAYVDRTAMATTNGAEALAATGMAKAVQSEVAKVVQAEVGRSVNAEVAKAIATVKTEAKNENGALRNVALVRYDAFTEMSGRMSFSLALLDSDANGVVISAIASSTDTRVYAKGVSQGQGEHELSPEEESAVSSARKTRASSARTSRAQRKAS
jgi:hypothetical protein